MASSQDFDAGAMFEGEDGEILETTDIVETTDEDGVVHVFEKVSEIEVDGQEYALLIYRGQGEEGANNASAKAGPEADDEDEDEVVVMKISYEDGAEVYEAIEDEDEFERVVAAIEELDDEDDDSAVAIDLGELGKRLGGIESDN
jgi:Protein of unknown function (DUF1292)